ncbi:VOC family protein [Pseudoruegeria sp. SK021]|uniref:VOC family protein n=1 Tax=Pseudoruegeria sp. SK021 TaxID=1933035 RepID=UPI000A2541FB|nr:VOC family protein [Pseudoruegeria sp. SK021]OSP55787.1 hypothetical protein BV911_05235 [Pseudoruegeria sp. SK021]
MSDPIELGLSHVALPTRDIARSVTFYRAFGMAPKFCKRDGSGDIILQQLSCAAGFVELVKTSETAPAPDAHFGLHAPDLAPVLEHLTRAGITPTTPVRRGISGVDFVFFRDPSGNLVELTAPIK